MGYKLKVLLILFVGMNIASSKWVSKVYDKIFKIHFYDAYLAANNTWYIDY